MGTSPQRTVKRQPVDPAIVDHMATSHSDSRRRIEWVTETAMYHLGVSLMGERGLEPLGSRVVGGANNAVSFGEPVRLDTTLRVLAAWVAHQQQRRRSTVLAVGQADVPVSTIPTPGRGHARTFVRDQARRLPPRT